jgi:hypothetical protein
VSYPENPLRRGGWHQRQDSTSNNQSLQPHQEQRHQTAAHLGEGPPTAAYPHDEYHRQAAHYFGAYPSADAAAREQSPGSLDAPTQETTRQIPSNPTGVVIQQIPTTAVNVKDFGRPGGVTPAKPVGGPGVGWTPKDEARSAPTSPTPPSPSAAPPMAPPVPAQPPPSPQQPHFAAAGYGYFTQQPSSFGPARGPAQKPSTATASADGTMQWLSEPGHIKLLIGAVGAFVAAIMLFAGDSGVKVAGLVLGLAVWAVCFRQGYHEKAGLRVQTRVPPEETTRIAVDIANALRGPLSSVDFNGSSAGRADFTVRGVTWAPLAFHVALATDPSGWIFMSTHIDKWTWRRVRWNFIPVPFTKRMDGYGLYRSFGDRLLKTLQQRDPGTTGQFHKRPQ